VSSPEYILATVTDLLVLGTLGPACGRLPGARPSPTFISILGGRCFLLILYFEEEAIIISSSVSLSSARKTRIWNSLLPHWDCGWRGSSF